MRQRDRKDPEALGRYRIVGVIGSGGMGRVLLGQGPDGRLVAVKQIHAELTNDSEFRARFEREIHASGKVTGAYTAGIVGYEVDAENPWLASEYVAGPSLHEAVNDFGRLNPSGLKLLAIGLAMALLEIHRAGLVHRDLKPGNVLLTNEGPRVIDFGIARALEGDVSLTATGAVIGSPAYMSPEQAECQTLTPASDVFSAGAVLAMAATGVSPFAAVSTPQTLYNVLYVQPDTSGIPEPMRAMVDWCLNKDPGKRPSPSELLDAATQLDGAPVWPVRVRRRVAEYERDALAWSTGEAAPLTEEQQPSRPRREFSRVRALGAVVIVSVLALLGSLLVGIGVKGNAVAMADPPLTLTDREAQLLDMCALLEPDVVGEFGTFASAPQPSDVTSCSVAVDDPTGKRVSFKVSTDFGWAYDDAISMGSVLAWLPVQGNRKEGRTCDRFVQLQTGLRIPINVDASGLTDSCPMAERVLAAIVRRLQVNPPLRKVAANSTQLLNPCAIMDREMNLRVLGDPAAKNPIGAHECWVTGINGEFHLGFGVRTRNDNKKPTGNYDKPTVFGGRHGLIDDRGGFCEYTLTILPTHDELAEQAVARFIPYDTAITDGCDRLRTVLSPVLAKLPQS
ncbi:serine/threonine-protein kinase [Nocardia camponoti]|uniref:Protein kinase domain-containing protein n=1 Tax=Nocardia camponoti TaxID=1616106 RepID=A0A917QRV7_9NOCA|nr:serine/threonine-protein kinase [Nocardia camponoti]GGK64567.1 hypothetical protein GCM10011591_40970 [Nocardia camponoti]